MKSKNNVYLELSDKVYKRYKKAQLGALAGTRCNPHDLKQRVPFLLVTPDESVNWIIDTDGYSVPNGIASFNYDNEVLEVYSQEEDTILKRINPTLFSKGLLVEYLEQKAELDISNALTDEDITRIASSTNPKVFRNRLKNITSLVTLDRIDAKLKELDRKLSFSKELQEHRNGL